MRTKSSREILMAPPASSGATALKLPGASPFPPVDEHIVEPETREEMFRGERVIAQPALEPHGDRHFDLDYVLRAHVATGYVGSTDLLTRVAHGSDFATDVCIRKAGIDPETGHRYLEELAFEVVHTQSLKKVTERAEDLSQRGVRRVFAIFVKTGRLEEWAHQARAWRVVNRNDSISDPCLNRALAARALLDAAAADSEVVRALEAKGNPVIVSIKTESKKEGEVLGAQREAANAVLTVLTSRGIEVSAPVRAAIEGSTDVTELRRWLVRASTATSADEVIDAR